MMFASKHSGNSRRR
ncbi:hypothetical protein E2C01_093641 [Portunus trituberculatus]|uniref:Uncharacterized protein n=1 Tax=Portunus trituberculatus TaxID=210409 RepID=A0A5B7JZ99_PORTR|nr:hypothetical protein [Portunus trituberculatus]